LAQVIKPGSERGAGPERSADDLNFVKLISHELRGPTTLLRGHLSMWLEGDPVGLPAEIMPALRTCYGSVLQLNNLINQMILAVRIHDNVLIPSARPVDFTNWLRGLAHDISMIVVSTGHGLQLELPPTAVVADGDVFLLATAVFNLVDNAQKFSARGSIIRVALRSETDRIAIEVIDQGQGFPDGFKLEPFARIDRELGFERPGVGVGLFIAQGVARAHGGGLDFVSSLKGSTVRLTLPAGRERTT
jgi:signal transduction histidine kinase